jgi:glycine hydroxymethyltransferase
MYLLKKFAGEDFQRINLIIDNYNGFQNRYINLIASASYAFPEITDAMRYPLFTLPTEGFAPQRYFPASKYMDEIEELGEQLCLDLFNIQTGYRVNLQPHSGTQANHIVYNTVLKDDDTILSLNSTEGGHISHSKFANGTIRVINYKLNNTAQINIEQIRELAHIYKPRLIIAGVSSYPREVDFQQIASIAKEHASYLLADVSHTAVFIAGEVHKTIFPYVDFATFTMEKNLRGPHGGVVIYREDFHKKICYSTFPVSQGGPIQNMLLAKLVAFQLWKKSDIKKYAHAIVFNAIEMCNVLIDGGVNIVTGGTDSHIVLVDLSQSLLNGKEAETLLQENLILANRNLIPGDKGTPLFPSGIRFGTTTLTNLNYEIGDIRMLSKNLALLLNKKEPIKAEISYLINKYHAMINIASEGKG